ncbi:MAG: hypothetical protein EKK71_15180 [Candidatus Competibacteraceae bacterium]|nr:MAG: hypothetical protein EKK71_15180 [Candidatus Competibacteraceae bacterium]
MNRIHQPPQSAPPQPPRILLSVRNFSERHPAFPAATLRDLIFKAEERYTSKGKLPGNGLLEAGAVIRVGRKVLIDEARFFAWIDSIQPASAKA